MTTEKIVTSGAKDKVFAAFGEIMLRLAAPGYERLLQSPVLEATFGGGEANVLVSLACLGKRTRYLTALPKNDIAADAIRQLRGFGVDTDHILLVPGSRMGIYFLEKGANQRPSRVIYDRIPSAVSTIAPGAIDWEEALRRLRVVSHHRHHPGAVQKRRRRVPGRPLGGKGAGLVISIDLNYRSNLWKWGKAAPQVMGELAAYADVIIANEEDCQKALGIGIEYDPGKGVIDEDGYRRLTGEVLERYPNACVVAITLRESLSASANRWGAVASDGKNVVFSRKYDITHIVDRVGSGDAFAAGLIYGLCHLSDLSEALEFAAAASCLAHSIPGDWNRCGLDEITALTGGDAAGRIKR